jgi:glutaredoxin-like protein NrdH
VKVTVWTTKNCVQCMMTKKQFDKLGIEYEEKSLEDNLEQLEAFKAEGYLQAPIITTDIKVWSGFKMDKIESLNHYLRSENRKPL